jgi:hypothetical protein
MLPDYPNRPNPLAFWFNKTHGELAMARLARHKRAEPKPVTLAAFKRTFSGWTVVCILCLRRTDSQQLVNIPNDPQYFIAVLYIATVLASYGYVYFSLFLKALRNPDGTRRWSTEAVNAIPIGGGAINVVFGESCSPI